MDYKALTYSIVFDSDGKTGYTGAMEPSGEGDVPADVTMLLFAYKQPGDNPVPWPAYPGARASLAADAFVDDLYVKDGAPPPRAAATGF